MKITAAVLRAADGPYALEEVELAEPASGQVRVRIVGAGLCHTDLLPRVPDFPAAVPIVTGHEGSGVVDAVGPDVTDVAVGDHVVLSFDHCGECVPCTSGHPAYCTTFFERNLFGPGLVAEQPITDAAGAPVASRWFGQSSFASHALVGAHTVVKVDPSLPLEKLGPLGCGVLTGAGSMLSAMTVAPGSSVVVFGAGGVGISAVMAAKLAGAAVVVAVDLNPTRLTLATELGATHTADGADPDLLATLLELTGGGAHVTLDTTGVPAVITTAINALRVTGVAGLVGVQQGDVVLEPMAIALGKTIMGIIEGDAVPRELIPRLIEHWQRGEFPFDRLITTFPFEQINEAEQAGLSGAAVKPVLLVGQP